MIRVASQSKAKTNRPCCQNSHTFVLGGRLPGWQATTKSSTSGGVWVARFVQLSVDADWHAGKWYDDRGKLTRSVRFLCRHDLTGSPLKSPKQYDIMDRQRRLSRGLRVQDNCKVTGGRGSRRAEVRKTGSLRERRLGGSLALPSIT